jgi:hypothetical protein
METTIDNGQIHVNLVCSKKGEVIPDNALAQKLSSLYHWLSDNTTNYSQHDTQDRLRNILDGICGETHRYVDHVEFRHIREKYRFLYCIKETHDVMVITVKLNDNCGSFQQPQAHLATHFFDNLLERGILKRLFDLAPIETGEIYACLFESRLDALNVKGWDYGLCACRGAHGQL